MEIDIHVMCAIFCAGAAFFPLPFPLHSMRLNNTYGIISGRNCIEVHQEFIKKPIVPGYFFSLCVDIYSMHSTTCCFIIVSAYHRGRSRARLSIKYSLGFCVIACVSYLWHLLAIFNCGLWFLYGPTWNRQESHRRKWLRLRETSNLCVCVCDVVAELE